MSFTSATADATGKDRRTVERAAARGKALADDLSAIAGQHGGAHNPHGRAGKPETEINIDNVKVDYPTGNSKDQGLRRLRKAAEAGAYDA